MPPKKTKPRLKENSKKRLVSNSEIEFIVEKFHKQLERISRK